MKTVVFAYHDMGCLGIEALLSAGYEISAIFTHTDNPGEKAFYGSVARLAAERGIPVYAPRITLIIRCGWNALPNCHQR